MIVVNNWNYAILDVIPRIFGFFGNVAWSINTRENRTGGEKTETT